jgi:hypothetical protein
VKRREKKVREWKEIGGLLLTDSGTNLLVRANAFSQDGSQIRSIDVVLRSDEMHELYTELKRKLETALKDKSCAACKYCGYYGCLHPSNKVSEYECRREQNKYFEPRYQL